MIEDFIVKNFKCFAGESKFKFSKLNLLTGINGRGKSSLLQSILVMCQSFRRHGNLNHIILNGELVDLGNFDDIKNSDTPKLEDIIIKLKLSNTDLFSFHFKENPDDQLVAKQNKILRSSQEIKFDEIGGELIKILRTTHFVSANRLGPRKYVEKSNLPEFINVGSRGEYCINILSQSMNLPNVSEKLYIGQDAKSLIQQTTEWLNYILDGAKLDIKGQNADSSVLYMLMNNRNNSYSYKPNNVGFGYSYILPLIVSGLIAKPNEILIVENPEAHLHPRAQSRIAEFFARVASNNVQVFIESHSEHILNGLRLCSLRQDIEITNTDLSIQYFNESFEPIKLQINEDGKIENWPVGFFDQQEIDISQMFKLRK